jgi:hypothetical protein
VPECHGIAQWSHHSLATTLVLLSHPEDQSEPSKRLRAELHIQDAQGPKLAACLDKVLDGDQDDVAWDAIDECETSLLSLLPKALTAKQFARFEELLCQLEGPMVLRHARYASRLELSEAQRARVRSLVETYTDKSLPLHRALFSARSQKQFDSVIKKLISLARELDDKILGVLTEKQRASWASFLGKAFDWEALANSL